MLLLFSCWWYCRHYLYQSPLNCRSPRRAATIKGMMETILSFSPVTMKTTTWKWSRSHLPLSARGSNRLVSHRNEWQRVVNANFPLECNAPSRRRRRDRRSRRNTISFSQINFLFNQRSWCIAECIHKYFSFYAAPLYVMLTCYS